MCVCMSIVSWASQSTKTIPINIQSSLGNFGNTDKIACILLSDTKLYNYK